MSTLTTLKHRARVLAAAVALSAATLALSSGVAEATDTTDCLCRVIGDITNTEEPASGGQDNTTTTPSNGGTGQQPSNDAGQDNLMTAQDTVDIGDIDAAKDNTVQGTLIGDNDKSAPSSGQPSDNTGSSGPAQDNDAGDSNTGTLQDTLDAGDISALNDNTVQVAGVGDNDSNGDSASGEQPSNNAGNPDADQNNDAGDGNTGTLQDTLDAGDISAANGNNIQVAGAGDNDLSGSAPSGQQPNGGNDGSSGPAKSNDAGQDNLMTAQDTVDIGDIDAAKDNTVQGTLIGDNNLSDAPAPGGQQNGDSNSSGPAQSNDTGQDNTGTLQDTVDLGNVDAAKDNTVQGTLIGDNKTSDSAGDGPSNGGGGPGSGGGSGGSDGGGSGGSDGGGSGGGGSDNDSGKKPNSGNGNGSEDGDPGNSGGHNSGGDEAPDTSNPGGNNDPSSSDSTSGGAKNSDPK